MLKIKRKTLTIECKMHKIECKMLTIERKMLTIERKMQLETTPGPLDPNNPCGGTSGIAVQNNAEREAAFYSTLSINDKQDAEKQIAAYPNPANAELTIQQVGYELTTVELSDVTGRIIVSYPVNKNANNININLSVIPNGVYFIKALASDGQTALTEKVIIQH